MATAQSRAQPHTGRLHDGPPRRGRRAQWDAAHKPGHWLMGHFAPIAAFGQEQRGICWRVMVAHLPHHSHAPRGRAEARRRRVGAFAAPPRPAHVPRESPAPAGRAPHRPSRRARAPLRKRGTGWSGSLAHSRRYSRAARRPGPREWVRSLLNPAVSPRARAQHRPVRPLDTPQQARARAETQPGTANQHRTHHRTQCVLIHTETTTNPKDPTNIVPLRLRPEAPKNVANMLHTGG